MSEVMDQYTYADDDDLLTRDDLVARLNAAGMRFTARKLHQWEADGWAPSPRRRWSVAGDRSSPRAMYPATAVATIQSVVARRAAIGYCPCCGQRIRTQRSEDVTA